jgi:GntR family transcriptional repressor for pyruvate dehydrogenase complex
MADLKLPRMGRGRSLADEVTDELRRRVDGGDLAPGDRLPTGAELSAAFGVSLAVVREAMSRLKHDGLIETQQGSGAFVADRARPKSFRLDGRQGIEAELLVQIYEMRLAIESEAARLAAIRRDPGHLARMQATLDDIDAAIRNGEDGVQSDQNFHRLVAEAAGNPLFLDFWNFLSTHIQGAIATARANSARAGLGEQAQQEHYAIFRAISEGRETAARDAAAAHVRSAAQRLDLSLS